MEALARAYNQKGAYEESISLGWGCSLKDEKWGGYNGFSGNIRLKFERDFLKVIWGVEVFNEKHTANEHPIYGKHTPLFQLGNDTKLIEIFKEYHEREKELKNYRTSLMHSYNLHELGYNVSDVLLAVFQIGNKIFPTKKNVENNQDIIIKASSNYKPAPEDFDFD